MTFVYPRWKYFKRNVVDAECSQNFSATIKGNFCQFLQVRPGVESLRELPFLRHPAENPHSSTRRIQLHSPFRQRSRSYPACAGRCGSRLLDPQMSSSKHNQWCSAQYPSSVAIIDTFNHTKIDHVDWSSAQQSLLSRHFETRSAVGAQVGVSRDRAVLVSRNRISWLVFYFLFLGG